MLEGLDEFIKSQAQVEANLKKNIGDEICNTNMNIFY